MGCLCCHKAERVWLLFCTEHFPCLYLDKVASLLRISCSYGAWIDQKSCQLAIESSKTAHQVATKHCLELEEPERFQNEKLDVDVHLLLSVILASRAMTSSFSKAALPARTSSPSEEYRGGVPPNSKGGVGERFKEAITSLEMKIAITFSHKLVPVHLVIAKLSSSFWAKWSVIPLTEQCIVAP